jgi:chromate reductase
MTAPRILAFSGSLRAGSFNDKLVAIAAAGARSAGADVTHLHLREYPLPVYDGDLEAKGTPDAVMQLKQVFREHDGLLISSPEYNSSISAALKNAIDWVSRPEEGRPPLDCFAGKVAALMSAAAGGLGGMRGLPHVRAILQNIQVMVLPTMIGIPAAHEAFDDAGDLKDAKKQQAVEALGAELAATLTKLKA